MCPYFALHIERDDKGTDSPVRNPIIVDKWYIRLFFNAKGSHQVPYNNPTIWLTSPCSAASCKVCEKIAPTPIALSV